MKQSYLGMGESIVAVTILTLNFSVNMVALNRKRKNVDRVYR